MELDRFQIHNRRETFDSNLCLSFSLSPKARWIITFTSRGVINKGIISSIMNLKHGVSSVSENIWA